MGAAARREIDTSLTKNRPRAPPVFTWRCDRLRHSEKTPPHQTMQNSLVRRRPPPAARLATPQFRSTSLTISGPLGGRGPAPSATMTESIWRVLFPLK